CLPKLVVSMESKADRSLPRGWVVRTSKSRVDRSYYFNTVTGLSSWKHPLDISTCNKSDSPSPKKKRRSRDATDSSSIASGDVPSKRSNILLSPVSPTSQYTSVTVNSVKNRKSVVVTPIRKSTDQDKPEQDSKESVQINGTDDTSKASSKRVSPPEHHFQCSRARANNIALWVDRVNSTYEPSEQGSTVSNVASTINSRRLSLKDSTIAAVQQKKDGYTKKKKRKRKRNQGGSTGNNAAVPEWNKSSVKSELPKLTQRSDNDVARSSKVTQAIEPTSVPQTKSNNTKTNTLRPPLKKVNQKTKNANSTPLSPTKASGFPSKFTINLFTPFGQNAQQQDGRNEPQSMSTPMNIDRNSQRFSTPFMKSPPPNRPQELFSSTINMNLLSSSNEIPTPIQNPFANNPQQQCIKTDVLESPQGASVNNSTEALNMEDIHRHSQRDSGFDEVIDMDVDNFEEMTQVIKAELQEVRSEFQFDERKVCAFILDGRLYIILDTNVLLSHLKYISELKDVPIEGIGRPVLVVPWIVMQELDSLKSDSWRARQSKTRNKDKDGSVGVDMLARQAIRFLHSCFESKHPRLRGQTVDEASEHLNSMLDETNDDRILHCCLVVKRKVSNGESVLFSNDQNLCNKAMINGVKAFNHQNLMSGLKEFADTTQANTLAVQADYFKDYYQELAIQEKLAQKRAQADDILCELKCILREGLAVAVEAEMRLAYDDLWDKIVYLKPPWTLMDLLQILNKHWIAVFGDVVRRSLQATVKELMKILDPEKGVPGCISNVSQILQHAQRLFDAFALRSSYNGAITKCVAAIRVLLQKCNECKNEHLPTLSLPGNATYMAGSARVPQALPFPEPSTPLPTHVNESRPPSPDDTASVASVSVVSVQGEINSTVSKHPHSQILSTFEVIWSAVTQFSAQIFNALSYPNSIPESVIENLPKPTRDEAISFLGLLCRCLGALVTALHNVLRVPAEGLSEFPQMLEKLVFSIRSFVKEVSVLV
ncbi:hypothetical protein QZH41_015196, partial [Actinostola sp. cb2023]